MKDRCNEAELARWLQFKATTKIVRLSTCHCLIDRRYRKKYWTPTPRGLWQCFSKHPLHRLMSGVCHVLLVVVAICATGQVDPLRDVGIRNMCSFMKRGCE